MADTKSDNKVLPHFPVSVPRFDWLASHQEEIIDPARPIVDPHHHLWDHAYRYLLPELLADIGSGHNVRATIYMQCESMYRADGPEERKSLGETEFVTGVAAMGASGTYGEARPCHGIVGFVDLTLGSRATDLLKVHMDAAGGRFKGVRHMTARDEKHDLPHRPPARLMYDSKFREGLACLAPLGLSYDAFLFFSQIQEMIDLARALPGTTMILDHVGGVMGIGPYQGKRDEMFPVWKAAMAELAKCPNVNVKLGGLGMRLSGFGFNEGERPPTSEQLAAAWKPWIETSIELFGPDRCMFESNFPVDKLSCSYQVMWNGFKRLAAGASEAEKTALFSGTAAKVYRLSVP